MDLRKLAEPFPAEGLEWRILQSGAKNGKPWAKCVAYVTNRAIMERLDAVCGPENWRNRFAPGPDGGVVCGIAIRVERGGDAEWVEKWDGAENTDIEGTKGGISGAMKRAAVQWGCGRYLYSLDEGWATFEENGPYTAKIDGAYHRWSPPKLPEWALPKDLHASALAFVQEVGARCDDDVQLTLDNLTQPLKDAVRKAWPTLKRDRDAALTFARAVADATGQPFNA